MSSTSMLPQAAPLVQVAPQASFCGACHAPITSDTWLPFRTREGGGGALCPACGPAQLVDCDDCGREVLLQESCITPDGELVCLSCDYAARRAEAEWNRRCAETLQAAPVDPLEADRALLTGALPSAVERAGQVVLMASWGRRPRRQRGASLKTLLREGARDGA